MRYGFPTDGNFCHREGAPRAIQLDYQQDVCLGGRYTQCPIFQQSGPVEAPPAPAPPAPRRRSRRAWLLVLLVLLLALCTLIFNARSSFENFFGSGEAFPTETPAEGQPEPVLLPSLTALPTLAETFPPAATDSLPATAAQTETASPSPTATQTALPLPTETPTNIPPTNTSLPTQTPTEIPPSPTPEEQKVTDTPAP